MELIQSTRSNESTESAESVESIEPIETYRRDSFSTRSIFNEPASNELSEHPARIGVVAKCSDLVKESG